MQIPTRYISYDCVYMYIVASSCGGNLSIDLLSVSRSRAFVSSSTISVKSIKAFKWNFCRSFARAIGAIGIVGIIGGWLGYPLCMYSCVLGFMFSSRFQLLQVVNVVIPFNQGRGTAREGSAGGGGEGCPPASSQTSSANVSLVFFSLLFFIFTRFSS